MGPWVCVFITKNLKCYKFADIGWISKIRVSTKTYEYSYCFLNYKKTPKYPKDPLKFSKKHICYP